MSQNEEKKIILIDDDPEMLSFLSDFLSAKNFSPILFNSAAEALSYIQSLPPLQVDEIDLVITDFKMPKMSGIEFIQTLKKIQPKLPIILITAFGTIESAIEAIRMGAFDYIIKPFQLNEIELAIDKALEFKELKIANSLLRTEIKKSWSLDQIIGKSKAMQDIFHLIERIAPVQSNVLITGESGTGKELVARALHNLGPRKTKPFLAINCSAIPENLLESELFGHSKGSFTGAIQKKKGIFEEANHGTLFLDEIGDMGLNLQTKLLRVLQDKKIRAVGETLDKEIDLRIITATNRDLKKAIKEGFFRDDLYFRLNVIPIHLPPLRERKEDIPLLANHFLKKYTSLFKSPVKEISKNVLTQLCESRWEGNIRELENTIERLVVLCQNETIDEIYFTSPVDQESNFKDLTYDYPTLQELEKRYIQQVLQFAQGKKEKASHILGINRRTLLRKEIEYGFQKDKLDGEEEDQPQIQ